MLRLHGHGGTRQCTDIVDPFEHDEIADAILREDISIEARESIRPKPIGKQAIPTDAFVEDSNSTGACGTLQPRCESVGPAVVAVRGRSMAIRDGVAQDDDGGCIGGSRHIHSGEKIPVIYRLRRRQFGG